MRQSLASTMERAANAEQKAAEADLARMKIEEKLAPRILSQEQYNSLCDKLKLFSGISVDILLYPEGAPDIVPLSQQIESVFHEAAWNVKGIWTTIGSGMCVRGIVVQTKTGSSSDIETIAQSLVEGLNSVGIIAGKIDHFPSDGTLPAALSGPPWNKNDTAPIRMLVGTKP